MSVPSEGFVRRADLAILLDASRDIAQQYETQEGSQVHGAIERVAAYLDDHPPMSPADPRSSAPPG